MIRALVAVIEIDNSDIVEDQFFVTPENETEPNTLPLEQVGPLDPFNLVPGDTICFNYIYSGDGPQTRCGYVMDNNGYYVQVYDYSIGGQVRNYSHLWMRNTHVLTPIENI